MTYSRLLIAVALAATLAGALTHAQARIEPIRAQASSVPTFDQIDVARGSFRVFGVDDVYARQMGISELMVQTTQVTGRLQIFATSGGEQGRARFVCATFEGVIFGADRPCDQVAPPPPIDIAR